MDITLQFPDNLEEQISKLKDPKSFIITATKKALFEQWKDDKTMKALKRADLGEYANDNEVKEFFEKWSDCGN